MFDIYYYARPKGSRYFMAALVIQALNIISGGTRTLLLILLVLAVVLIMAGAVIAVFTLSYARKQRASLTDRQTSGEQR